MAENSPEVEYQDQEEVGTWLSYLRNLESHSIGSALDMGRVE